jgi:hypothetical protein
MKTRSVLFSALVLAAALIAAPAVMAFSEVAAGTRFLVELRDKLDASKKRAGDSFEARTLEALPLTDGGYIPAGAKVKGRISSSKDRELLLRFERIETRRGKAPLIASVVQVVGEKDVKDKPGGEGEIRSSGGRKKPAAIGALIGAAAGAAIGKGAGGGGKEAAIGAGAGAGAGALIGAAAGGRDLVLQKGARLELQLDRPLVFE